MKSPQTPHEKRWHKHCAYVHKNNEIHIKSRIIGNEKSFNKETENKTMQINYVFKNVNVPVDTPYPQIRN